MPVIDGKKLCKPLLQLAQLFHTALLPWHGSAVCGEKEDFHTSA